jgi:glycosyltransferase involved in cell wall biosynthesis
MIVRNEREHLANCLGAVRGWADEIIVVDTGSNDGTQALAAEFGAEVVQTTWADDFSLARNLGLDRARGEWILVLDADEVLRAEDRESITRLLAGRKPQIAFRLWQKSSSDGGRTGMIVPIVRLFPKVPAVRYEWPIHEQVETSLGRAGIPIEDTRIEILHYGYADPVRNKAKQQRNRAILRRQIDEGNGTALTWFLLGGAHLDLGELESALAAYTECRHLAGNSEVGEGARIRVVTCLVGLKRFADALAEIEGDVFPGRTKPQPELELLRGQCELAAGNADAARVAFQQVLAAADGAYVPPCNLEDVKTNAALALAGLVKAEGNAAGAVAVLRAVKARRQAGQPITSEVLEGC